MSKNNGKLNIYDILDNYIKSKYHIRNNTNKLEIEVSDKGKDEYISLNENDLIIELSKSGLNKCSAALNTYLGSSYVPKYNPIENYFTELGEYDPTNESDYILELSKFVKAKDQEQFSHHLKKWMVRAVTTALVHGYGNKQALILVHDKQNSGKSTFCRFLIPPKLKEYFKENIPIGKDGLFTLAQNFLINLDELASLSKKDINELKQMFSLTEIKARPHFARKDVVLPRICSFVGSTNLGEFLTDETGSVRWLCFEIDSIDWRYKDEIKIENVWKQAYWLFKNHKVGDFDLTKKEIEENESRNSQFQVSTAESELLDKYFEPSEFNDIEAYQYTATEIANFLMSMSNRNQRINPLILGRTLNKQGYKSKQVGQAKIKKYFAKPLFTPFTEQIREKEQKMVVF